MVEYVADVLTRSPEVLRGVLEKEREPFSEREDRPVVVKGPSNATGEIVQKLVSLGVGRHVRRVTRPAGWTNRGPESGLFDQGDGHHHHQEPDAGHADPQRPVIDPRRAGQVFGELPIVRRLARIVRASFQLPAGRDDVAGGEQPAGELERGLFLRHAETLSDPRPVGHLNGSPENVRPEIRPDRSP